MKVHFWMYCVCCLLIAGAAPCAVEVAVLYNGESTLPNTMQLGVWGARTGDNINHTPLPVTRNIFGLPVQVQGRYQGTRLDFTPPLDTTQFLGKPDTLLEFYLRPVETGLTSNIILPHIPNLRVTLFTRLGINTIDVPAEQFYPNDEVDNVWRRIAIPLAGFDKGIPLGGPLSRLVISTDTPAIFLIGRIAFVRDVAPLQLHLTAMPTRPRTGELISVSANAQGDLTPYEINWDFGARPTPSIDANGEHVKFSFSTPGRYTIAATISDLYSIKEAVTATLEIVVGE